MKKKSASQSAPARRSLGEGGFFNLRVLIGLFIVLAGVFLALAGFGTFSGITASSAQAQQTHKIIDIPGLPPGFDCSRIHALGIDKMENLRAGLIMIACGEAPGGGQAQKGEASPFRGLSQPVQKLLAPLAYGAADVDVVLPDGTYPSVTQSETYTTANPDNPNQIVINYNDSRNAPSNYSGVSYSSDGGATFHPIVPSPFATGHGTNFGDPVVLYNRPNATWHAIFLATGCGGQGIGDWKSTDGGVTWTVGSCAHNGSFDDRESGWADNNSASPFYGRMYVSWNDFATSCGAGGCLYSTHSSDGGVTWSTPVRVQTGSLFIRDVQITGDLAGSGTVYIAGMDEGGGGFPHNDTNYIYKSTDGGTTWTNTYVGTPFPGPGVCASGYFAGMFSTNGCYWRHEGWGEPAAINNSVHLVYAQHGTGSDPGDVYYIRSTDGGSTFGTPVKLNTDTTTRPQWQPNLSVSPGGTLLATWYDARVSPDTGCAYGNPSSPCYQMFSRKSNDNGATWLPDDTLSDIVSPLPAQPDGNVQGTYAGDYDYGTAITTKHLTSWDDGRVAIQGTAQQDVFTDRELVGFSVTSTVPACNSIINTQPVDFTVNLSDPALLSSVQASDFTVNGIPANSFTYAGPPSTQIIFHYTTSPVTTQGPQTMHIPAGAILRNSDSMPIFDFTCSFCYATTPLQVTTTVPPVGGTFSPAAPGTYTYDVNFNQPIDPGSVSTSDLTLTGNVGGSVTNVTVINGNTTAEFTVTFQFGGSVTASIAAGAITAEGCNPNAAFSGNYTVEGCPMMGWSPGASLPSVGVRLVGVDFPANGHFYAVGGRSADTAGSDFTHPFDYNPTTNTWTTATATFPDAQVNNMACGVLTVGGTPQIYCTGGNQAGGTTSNARVFSYNPVANTITLLTAADNWPGDASGTILPGGFVVVANKLYIMGGFKINTAMTHQTWVFDPTAPVGSRWLQLADYPADRGYIPATAIGAAVYTAGGSSTTDGVTLMDTNDSFKYDPAANTWTAIASIPRLTAETRALNFNGQMLVMGGGRTAPNPSNEVDIYDPGTNTWTTGSPVPAFMTARRNFPTDTDGTQHIWLTGGYAPSAPTDSTEVFGQGGAPMAQSAFSRKVHGGAGTFDIPLPLTGNVGIECRIGPTYQMIINFATSVTVQSASVTSGTGMVSSFSGSGTSEITVNLTGVTDQQRITMTLHGVNECTHMGDVPISMGVLVGDTNGDTFVNASDVAQTKSQVGQTVGGSNFREDVNADGLINSTDVTVVKSDVGHALPP